MTTIIKSGIEKIMKVFYNNKNSSFHLRDISRKTGLNENSVSRFLNQLEKENILKSKKDGNLKKYFIEKNNLTFSLFEVFDIERLEGLGRIRKKAIDYFLNKLNEKPVIVVLFGSIAKGNFRKDSDIDLFLIVNRIINTKDSEKYSEAQTGIKINCFQIKYSEFLEELVSKKDKVLQSAINSGYPLTNHVKYYSEVLK